MIAFNIFDLIKPGPVFRVNVVRIRFIGICLLLACSHVLWAQQHAPATLELMLGKLGSARSIQYDEISEDKSMFNDDTIRLQDAKRIFFDSSGNVSEADIVTQSDTHQWRTVFSNKRLYSLGADRSYSMVVRENYLGPVGDLFSEGGLIAAVRRNKEQHPERILRRNDTLVGGRRCAYYEIRDRDTTIDGERNFFYCYLAIDKGTHLPAAMRYTGYSVAKKDEQKIGAFYLFGKSLYRNIRLNRGKNDLRDFKVPEGYHLEKELPLLQEGAVAPDWEGADVNGKRYASKDFKGRVLLLFLSGIGCPNNELSVPVLNRLAAAYSGKAVQLMGVFPDGKDKLGRYVKTNHLQFPVLYNGDKIKNAYHAPGSPFFYIVDQNGGIVKSKAGYSADLEQLLTEAINKVLLQ
ncbi:peroxiredoxin family protein [Niabella drilacis]|uniref:Peroxiredoxin n=1 Tax=Niabella drilacis (strain DSM 25811 / CCM 8410 / CCUG 62505 / LMG 26954 / E90) TaxID=1285928 RepID=A0A1G6NN22_NIADE|nr:TlpA disulfide reductase family protein [Niabella drilacis]SDC68585.1 Peroxiredoxin [Niabella drilacis]